MTHSDKPYNVGFGKPPRKHRFKKGRSGNPRGRPARRKRPPPSDLLDGIAHALLKDQRVKIEGRDTVVPMFVAWTEKLVRDSLHESFKDRLMLVKYLIDFGVGARLRDLCEEEEESEPTFTEEHRRLMASVEADFPWLVGGRNAASPADEVD